MGKEICGEISVIDEDLWGSGMHHVCMALLIYGIVQAKTNVPNVPVCPWYGNTSPCHIASQYRILHFRHLMEGEVKKVYGDRAMAKLTSQIDGGWAAAAAAAYCVACVKG